MKTIIHRAESRGHANHGWLNSHHTFSFAGYYNPERMHFGALRVLNDDIVQGGTGFGAHPHENMEIISIPITGALEHRDSTGRHKIIRSGEVQIMSAGSGITHSEFNASKTESVNFLQIWVFPKVKDIEPRYEQKEFDLVEQQNRWVRVVSPLEDDKALWINQDAYFSLAEVEEQNELEYITEGQNSGVYLLIIDGEIELASNELKQRDAIAISEINGDMIKVKALKKSRLLLMEIPM